MKKINSILDLPKVQKQIDEAMFLLKETEKMQQAFLNVGIKMNVEITATDKFLDDVIL